MTRALHADQADRARRGEIYPVTLIVLRRFSDRPAGTVHDTHYISDRAVKYNYAGGVAREFLPMLVEVGDLASGINHLPRPDDGALFRRPVDIVLSNSEVDGARYYATLSSTKWLENAEVEISQVLLDSHTRGRVDLTANGLGFSGTEHTVFYRGYVQRVGPVSDSEIALHVESVLPQFEWAMVENAGARDAGLRYPAPIGVARGVPLSRLGVAETWTTETTARDAATVTVHDDSWVAASGDENFALLASAEGLEGITVDSAADGVLTVNRRRLWYKTLGGAEIGDSYTHQRGARVIPIPRQIDYAAGAVSHGGTSSWATSLDLYAQGDSIEARVQIPAAAYSVASGVLSISRRHMIQILMMMSYRAAGISRDGWDSSLTDASGAADPYGDAGRFLGRESIPNAFSSGDAFTFKFDEGPSGSGNAAATGKPFFEPRTGTMSWSSPDWTLTPSGTTWAGTWHLTVPGFFSLMHPAENAKGTVAANRSELLEGCAFGNLHAILFSLEVEGDTNVASSSDRHLYRESQGPGTRTLDQIGTTSAPTEPIHYFYQSSEERDTLFSGAAGNNDSALFPLLADSGTAADAERMVVEFVNFSTASPRELQSTTVYLQGCYGWVYDDDDDVWGDDDTAPVRMQSVRHQETYTPPDLYADLTGPVAPGAGYTVAEGTVLTHPADVLRYFIVEIMGEGVDSSSFSAAASAYTAGSAQFGFLGGDLRQLGVETEDILAALAFECRANLVAADTASGRVWKMLTPARDAAAGGWSFPAAARSITQWAPGGFVLSGRALEDVATSFRASFDHDPARAQGVEFRRAATMDAAASDGLGGGQVSTTLLAACEAAVGRRVARNYAFKLWRPRPSSALGAGESAALDAFFYYATEQTRIGGSVTTDPAADLYLIDGIPWWEGYDVECGDIISATPPWGAAAIKMRVLEVTKSFRTETVSIRALVVP